MSTVFAGFPGGADVDADDCEAYIGDDREELADDDSEEVVEDDSEVFMACMIFSGHWLWTAMKVSCPFQWYHAAQVQRY